MAFSGIGCPNGHSHKHVFRKRRSGIRYTQYFDPSGIAIGEFKFYQLHCHACETLFYLQEQHCYATPEASPKQWIVSEAVFQKASLHKPGTLQVGTTASEYSITIAARADHPYALRQLRSLNA